LRPMRLHWVARVGSTNTYAARLRRAKRLYAPAVVLTGHQIAGRGRGGNTWISGEGSVTTTLALPAASHLLPHQIPLAAGVAVREAAQAVVDAADPSKSVYVQLKWPNDLLIAGAKVAGLLCERVDGVDLIGVGLNVNFSLDGVPAALRPKVTSLAQWLPALLDLTDVLLRVARGVHRTLSIESDVAFAS